MTIRTCLVDYNNAEHAADLIRLLDIYAHDPQGGACGLSDHVKELLPQELAQLNYAFSVLLYVGDQAVGLANCFDGFSTFAAKPLVNIHDFAIDPNFRGQGLAKVLLGEIERIAREKGCCKVTLEVLEHNTVAQRAYEQFGFAPYQLDEHTGRAQFWQKTLIK